MLRKFGMLLLVLCAWHAHAQSPRVIDVPTRPGVTQRFLLVQPPEPKAVVMLFAGGHGGLQMSPDGTMKELRGNFLVRSRELFAAQGLAVAVMDAPSDRQSYPHLNGFRQTADHVADIRAAVGWLRKELDLPVWLIGTSRGTQSAGYIATQLPPSAGGPDGIVLTASVLVDNRGRPVPDMALDRISVPALVAHHRQDSCRVCLFSDLPRLTSKLKHLARTDVMIFEGGISVGDPCEARAHHGFNGIENEVVGKISAWILGK